MKKYYVLLACLAAGFLGMTQPNEWRPVTGHISTAWAAQVNPSNVLDAYPRPQMTRSQWTNLNGLWQYRLVARSEGESMPGTYDGMILVPFAIESSLSGVGKRVGQDSVLWYHRIVDVPAGRRGKRVLLHFGAVDWQADIFVNGQHAGSHAGGYDPFDVDITDQLKKGVRQELAVRVWDPSDAGPQPRGKQVSNPHGIWYTPVTGIWQTVWLEIVPETHITSIRNTPDIDKQLVTITADIRSLQEGTDEVVVSAWQAGEKISEEKMSAAGTVDLAIKDPHLWSPADPFLYDLKLSIVRKGKIVDEVTSYFGMRKISMRKDQKGIQRMLLNNQFLFQYGPLDQGWWPDGLYTAPTDEALRFDIARTKEMGFNMIRKHVKVEPARWYYYCDKIGMLVWQDMPSGDLGNQWENRPGVFGRATDRERTAESEAIYQREWKAIMECLHHFPSIVVWVPFNEAWGQFKTKEIVDATMQRDPSRLVNAASGGNFEPVGHITDLHNYPEPLMPDPDLFGADRILVLGEFGGLGLPVEDHTWQDKNNWGYQSFRNREELYEKYAVFINRIPFYIEKGLSAAVYTQTTDVEVETNGLMTYDRAILKMPVEKLQSIHQSLYSPSLVRMKP